MLRLGAASVSGRWAITNATLAWLREDVVVLSRNDHRRQEYLMAQDGNGEEEEGKSCPSANRKGEILAKTRQTDQILPHETRG